MNGRLKFEITDSFEIFVTEEDYNGIKNKKLIDFETLSDAIDVCKGKAIKEVSTKKVERDILYCSPILPNFNGVHVVQHIIKNSNTDIYILQRQKRPARFAFYSEVYDNVGLPGMLFALTVVGGIIQNVRVVAVKDSLLKSGTKLYRYPFTNVNAAGAVCLGSNKLSDYEIKEVNELHSFPSMFFMMAATHELSESQNSSGLHLRPFLDTLVSHEFNDDFLIENGFTYGKWIKEVIE